MTGSGHSRAGLGWLGIARLGLVQASIGALVMLATSLLNRVMVVELGLAAAIPAGFVAWHYAVQLARPIWGHESDRGGGRTFWIQGGMAGLALGALIAVNSTILSATSPWSGFALGLFAFTLIGAGVGAAGTSLLALLASAVAPERRPAAAAVTWIMMVAGIAGSAAIAGSLLEPFSLGRMAVVAGGIALFALLLALAAVHGVEAHLQRPSVPATAPPPFRDALRGVLDDPVARRFTAFVFVSMLAYSMQDLILEPYAGLVFAMSPGESTQLSGAQHGGILAGMLLAGIGGSAFKGGSDDLENWIVGGCLGSALALAGLAASASFGPGWPFTLNVVLLGIANGVFAVSAIGAMMGLAGASTETGSGPSEGIRMGVWGASQAVAFGLGGLLGAVGADAARWAAGSDATGFGIVFAAEAGLFLGAALLALKVRAATVVNPRAISEDWA